MIPLIIASAPGNRPTCVLTLGTQVGSEGIRSPEADGIIAVLIGAVSLEPTTLEYPNLLSRR
jgi:hypothetical protein